MYSSFSYIVSVSLSNTSFLSPCQQVKDLQTKITSPKHTSMRSSRETTEDLKSQIRRKDEELAMAESKVVF